MKVVYRSKDYTPCEPCLEPNSLSNPNSKEWKNVSNNETFNWMCCGVLNGASELTHSLYWTLRPEKGKRGVNEKWAEKRWNLFSLEDYFPKKRKHILDEIDKFDIEVLDNSPNPSQKENFRYNQYIRDIEKKKKNPMEIVKNYNFLQHDDVKNRIEGVRDEQMLHTYFTDFVVRIPFRKDILNKLKKSVDWGWSHPGLYLEQDPNTDIRPKRDDHFLFSSDRSEGSWVPHEIQFSDVAPLRLKRETLFSENGEALIGVEDNIDCAFAGGIYPEIDSLIGDDSNKANSAAPPLFSKSTELDCITSVTPYTEESFLADLDKELPSGELQVWYKPTDCANTPAESRFRRSGRFKFEPIVKDGQTVTLPVSGVFTDTDDNNRADGESCSNSIEVEVSAVADSQGAKKMVLTPKKAGMMSSVLTSIKGMVTSSSASGDNSSPFPPDFKFEIYPTKDAIWLQPAQPASEPEKKEKKLAGTGTVANASLQHRFLLKELKLNHLAANQGWPRSLSSDCPTSSSLDLLVEFISNATSFHRVGNTSQSQCLYGVKQIELRDIEISLPINLRESRRVELRYGSFVGGLDPPVLGPDEQVVSDSIMMAHGVSELTREASEESAAGESLKSGGSASTRSSLSLSKPQSLLQTRAAESPTVLESTTPTTTRSPKLLNLKHKPHPNPLGTLPQHSGFSLKAGFCLHSPPIYQEAPTTLLLNSSRILTELAPAPSKTNTPSISTSDKHLIKLEIKIGLFLSAAVPASLLASSSSSPIDFSVVSPNCLLIPPSADW